MSTSDGVHQISRQYDIAAKVFMIAIPVIVVINFIHAGSSGQPLPWNLILWGIGFEVFGLILLLIGRAWFRFMISLRGGNGDDVR